MLILKIRHVIEGRVEITNVYIQAGFTIATVKTSGGSRTWNSPLVLKH